MSDRTEDMIRFIVLFVLILVTFFVVKDIRDKLDTLKETLTGSLVYIYADRSQPFIMREGSISCDRINEVGDVICKRSMDFESEDPK